MMDFNNLSDWFVAVSAVGVAAMGLVEALKVVRVPFLDLSLATIGLNKTKNHLGKDAISALKHVYGPDAGSELLEGAWRKGPEEFAKILRNGLRMAIFSGQPTKEFLRQFGQEPEALIEAIGKLRSASHAVDSTEGEAKLAKLADERERVARMEAAIDARVEAAVAAGRDKYVSSMQVAASIVAVVGCLWVSIGFKQVGHGHALLVGLLAVPIAPVAKDLVGFLGSLRSSFEKTRAKA